MRVSNHLFLPESVELRLVQEILKHPSVEAVFNYLLVDECDWLDRLVLHLIRLQLLLEVERVFEVHTRLEGLHVLVVGVVQLVRVLLHDGVLGVLVLEARVQALVMAATFSILVLNFHFVLLAVRLLDDTDPLRPVLLYALCSIFFVVEVFAGAWYLGFGRRILACIRKCLEKVQLADLRSLRLP